MGTILEIIHWKPCHCCFGFSIMFHVEHARLCQFNRKLNTAADKVKRCYFSMDFERVVPVALTMSLLHDC